MDWMERIGESCHPRFIVGGVSDDGMVVFDMDGANHLPAAMELATDRVMRKPCYQHWWCTVYRIEPVADVRLEDGKVVVVTRDNAHAG